MKKYLFILILFTSNKCFTQQLTFQKYYVDSLDVFSDYFQVLQTSDHGYLTGNVRALIKTDSLGQIEWYKKYAYGNGSPSFLTNYQTYDNGYIATGYSLIMKLNPNYAISWKKELIGPFSNGYAAYTVKETQDHGFILGGELDLSYSYYCLIKTDSVGTVQWSKMYSSATGNDTYGSFALTSDGGYMLCGSSNTAIDTSSNHHDIKIIKTDSLGNPQWAKHYNRNIPDEVFCYHITATFDGGYVLTGSRNFDTFILKIDSVGNILWKKLYSYSALVVYLPAKWIEETHDHGLVVSAMLDGSGTLVFKTDSAGNLLWNRYYPSVGPVGSCVKETADGGFIIGAVGYAGTNTSGNSFDALCLIKTDALGHTNGCYEDTAAIIVTDIMDTVANVVVTDSNLNVTTITSTLAPVDSGYEFVLCPPIVGMQDIAADKNEIKIYPNPFTNKFLVSGFRFQVGEKIKVTLFDLMGEKVYEKEFSSNKTEEEINLSFLQPGVYFLNVKSDGKGYTRKIVKM